MTSGAPPPILLSDRRHSRLGRIGTVLLEAMRRFATDTTVVIAGRDRTRTEAIAARWPGVVVADSRDLAAAADMILLCIPPDAYRRAISEIAPAMKPQGVLVSVTNAVSLDDLGRWIQRPVVRIIPSPAHAAGRGVCLVTPGPLAETKHVERVTALLTRFSRPILTDVADSRIASNLAGSGPAILAAFCASFLSANADRARIFGSADLCAMMTESVAALGALLDEGATFEDVVARTATPGGTTEAAIGVLGSEAPALCARMVDATFQREAQLLGIPPPRPCPAEPLTAARG